MNSTEVLVRPTRGITFETIIHKYAYKIIQMFAMYYETLRIPLKIALYFDASCVLAAILRVNGRQKIVFCRWREQENGSWRSQIEFLGNVGDPRTSSVYRNGRRGSTSNVKGERGGKTEGVGEREKEPAENSDTTDSARFRH